MAKPSKKSTSSVTKAMPQVRDKVLLRFFAVGLILSMSTIHSQTFHGTAVYVLTTNTDAIVAMDTKMTAKNKSLSYSNVCKLTQHGNTLLALSGIETAGPLFLPNISTYDSQFVQVSNQQELQEAVKNWSGNIYNILEDDVIRLGREKMQAMSDGGQLTEAEFFTTDSNGKLINLAVYFFLRTSTDAQGSNIKVHWKPLNLDKPFHSFARGNDVEVELRNNTTNRAKKNQKVLKDLESAHTVQERKLALNQAVKLAAQWLPDDIGTPADIARVSNGRLEWLQRTHACSLPPGRQ